MTAKFVQKIVGQIAKDLAVKDAPKITWINHFFFIGPILLLILTRYYGRMRNYQEHAEQFVWLSEFVEKIGFPNQRLEHFLFWMLAAFILNFVLSFVFILLTRVPLREFGLQLPEKPLLSLLESFFMILAGSAVYYALIFNGLVDRLPMLEAAREGGTIFWVYEPIMLVQLLSVSFLFFSFFLFGTSKTLGQYAIFLTALAFALRYSHRSGIEVFLVLAAGLALSHLSLRHRSVFPAFFVIGTVAVIRDIIALIYHIGINGLVIF